MAFDQDYMDEMRRRQMLTPGSIPGDSSIMPDTSAVMAPDEEDAISSVPETATVTPTNAKLSPAMQKYQSVVDQQPNAADYKPSKGRRIMAAIAGGFTGIKDPSAGVKVAQGLISAPYDQAQSQWQHAMEGAQVGMTLDEKGQAQDIARQRAAAYTTSANARQTAADATDKYRKFQEANQPYHPKTEEENTRAELAKKGIVQSKTAPTGFAPVIPPRDFPSEEAAKATHAKELQGLKARQARELENLRSGHESSRSAAHDARVTARGTNKAETPATPKSQEEAEQIAIQNLLRQRPEFKAFVKGGEAIQGAHGVTGRSAPMQIKTPDELPKSGGGFLGMGGTSEAQASLSREQYRQFLSELDKHKKLVLGKKGAPAWDIQPEEE